MTDYSRYARQVVLPEVGVNGQSLLRDSSVLIVGLGGLGSAAAQYLAGAGIGRLLLADRDRIERSNLQRQTLYREADTGRYKVEAALAQLAALNPEADLVGLDASQWPQAVADADVVLDCTDNFPTRHAINAACVRARRPLVSGAAIRLEGQLAVFDLRRGGPCYRCLYPETGEVAERCEQAGILGPVVGVVGTMQALAALKLLLGIGDDAGRLQVWDAKQMSWRSHEIGADPECPTCGHPHV
ncbi:HesA/MoeB/ThiF family protein [Sinimarinibacterium flocculans]|uniref:Sulfur carrier protein ThiS adenylyltransferase/adenylyltransferase/sulfurtransferase n=1 Tax=Sinimarinibacterium flocculans TaxID=985250 RepID=A0A318EJR1_9GAMM|nr:HesA/MoeB/ThiF family protein [Sinimarinibacterium flocculans]PXV71431.1 sulfur carrier protein ThiS adenylyltransferase/adenylyltransferase/sulfurtransferase [Sinimarinibacterium flocculans]